MGFSASPFNSQVSGLSVCFLSSLEYLSKKCYLLPAMDVNVLKEKSKDFANQITNKKNMRIDIHGAFKKLQFGGHALVLAVIAALIVMMFFALAVFFITVRGAEEVLVPEVRGKQLTDALIEMQEKELYPKITRRYSETPGDEGTILDQNPGAGSIVKGYSKVSLVVSRGVIVDHVESYVGMNIDELKMKLQTLFAGSAHPLIILAEPQYKADSSPAGTIIAQDPPENTNISEPITLSLVVSRGPSFENTKVPNMIGTSVNDVLQIIARSRLIFDFTSHAAQNGEAAGTVTNQQQSEREFVPNYSHIKLEMAFPTASSDDTVYGIFSAELTDYPYPVPMKLEASGADGSIYTLVNFLHTGGSLTLPYAVSKETTLTLYVVDKEVKKITVR